MELYKLVSKVKILSYSTLGELQCATKTAAIIPAIIPRYQSVQVILKHTVQHMQ